MSGFNSYSNYAYATDLDVQSVVDKFNRENGLFLTYTVVRYEITYVGDKVAATVEVRAKLVSESNEYIESFAPGYGLSKDDKAVYKAITGAKKYATRLLYGLASEPKDEPESESPEVKTKRSFTLKENSDV
jgi:hypothetical protein